MVALYVAESAVVSLTVHDHVQLDRVTGTSAQRHGGLIPPGTTQVQPGPRGHRSLGRGYRPRRGARGDLQRPQRTPGARRAWRRLVPA
jgi:hypothetical protein